MKKNQFVKSYTFSDLFDGTFKILKYTWRNTLIVGSLAFMPVSFITVLMLQEYFKQIGSILNGGLESIGSESVGLGILYSFLPVLGLFLVLLVVMTVIDVFARALITVNTFKVIREEPVELKTLVFTVLKTKLGKLLLQVLALTGILFGVYIAGAIGIGLLSALLSALNSVLGIAVLIIGMIVFIGFILWLAFSFNFITEELLFTDVPVLRTFKKSLQLVQGSWWRVCGISMVFSIALSFGISIISSPITFAFMAPYSAKMLQSVLDGSGGSDFYKEIINLYTEAKFPLFLSSYITSVLSLLLAPVFNALFFMDLKFRKNQLDIDAEEQPVMENTPGNNQNLTVEPAKEESIENTDQPGDKDGGDNA